MGHVRAGGTQPSPAGVVLACCVPAALLVLNRQWWLLLQMLLLLGPLMAFLSPSFLQQLKFRLSTLRSGVSPLTSLLVFSLRCAEGSLGTGGLRVVCPVHHGINLT